MYPVQTVPITLPNGFSFSLVHIPGGEFCMGNAESLERDERTIHNVRLNDYYIGQFPVTQALWKAVMKDDNPSFFRGDKRPVEQVSWNHVVTDFLPEIRKLGGFEFRLPTEAEWEFAARGIEGDVFSGSMKLKEVGWFINNSHKETKPVGLKPPNKLGVFDMCGNVWEWCQDWYHNNYYNQCFKEVLVINPLGPQNGSRRVMRGGSCLEIEQECRSSYRNFNHPAVANKVIGFRLAASSQSIHPVR